MVSKMKRLFLLLIGICILLIPTKEQTSTVALLNNDEPNMIVNEYLINCENENIHTKNITDYIKEDSIIYIEPYINPIYQNKIENKAYEFINQNFDTNIQKFTDFYLSKIKEYSNSDYNQMYINGIKLNKIKAYLSKQELQQLIKKYPKLTYTISN